MILLFPYKEIDKALNLIVSKTIHRILIKTPGMLFLISICHSMKKYRGGGGGEEKKWDQKFNSWLGPL